MSGYSYSILIPIIPALFFIFLGLTGHKMKPIAAGVIGTSGLFISWILSLIVAYKYFFVDGLCNGIYPKILAFNTTWLTLTDKLHIDMGVLIDPISVMMLVVITTVSFMVHLYSIGYMKGERGYHRFFAFLSLFTFSMLGLVIATNIFQMYIFWELVGVSSYLLIGFYYERPTAVAASKKAFIVTRFADLGFLIGILVLSYFTGTFDFLTLTTPGSPIIAHAASITFMGMSIVTWACILIFMGGAGKSAMFPLHIWLPDAMEGPTPVSALIHAATMVVAGVYLVARLFPIYALVAPDALTVVAYVGGFTSLFAAVIACTQLDIKRVLAYSTMSQIGYMMLALGVSGYGAEHGLGFMASMFHLFTHAMFKALLFLGAGAIIHAVHSNYMNEMGGLRKYLPITHATFLTACLTIAGFPFLSAFFSKDEILTAAFEHDKLLFAIEYGVAGLTAFYMFRLYFTVFWGSENWKNIQVPASSIQHPASSHHTPHEAPYVMTIPLMFLAVASVFTGYIPFSKFVTSDSMPFSSHMEMSIAIPSVLIGLLGIAIAFIFYKNENSLQNLKFKIQNLKFYKWSYNKFYMDEVYLFFTQKVIFRFISVPVAWFDRHVVDGTMNGVSNVTNYVSYKIRGMQSGQLQQYAFVFFAGAIAFVLIFIYLWL